MVRGVRTRRTRRTMTHTPILLINKLLGLHNTRVPPLLVLVLGQGGWHRCGSGTGGSILMVGKFMLVVRRLIFRFNSLMTSLPCTKCHSLGHCEQRVTTLIHHKHISTRG